MFLRHPGASEISRLWPTEKPGGDMALLYMILQNVFCCSGPDTFAIFLERF